jgi:Zn-dependent protease with chaperone function
MAGRELAGTGAVVLDDPRPVAYCVAGRPAAIVVTSGAISVLNEVQLSAVLAHERAHLAGRHSLLTTLTRCLAATFPRVPLFAKGADEVARLAELAADDTAARSASPCDLVTALLAIATGTAVPGTATAPQGALAAASYAVPARVQRLLQPPAPRTTALFALLLGVLSAIFVLLPAALTAIAG